MKKQSYSILSFSIIISIIFCYIFLLSWNMGCKNNDVVIIIPEGSTVSSVGKLLYNQKCFSKTDIIIFKIIMKVTLKENKIYAGRYSLAEVSKLGELVKLITSTSGRKIKLTFIEGWSVEKYASKLQNSIGIDSAKFIEKCNSNYIQEAFDINAPSCEGFLYPDTYIFLTSYTEKQIIDKMVNQFLHIYNNFIKEKAKSIDFSINEVVTLASIIQGEAARRSEMNMISSVYHNRLNKKMLLQADPTIQYIIPGENRRLWNKDLKIKSLYNTYLHKGLPPGPISNPGLSALIAVINPEKSDYLYFVADAEGGHIFSKTVREHKNAVKIFQRKRRQNNRK